MSKEPYLRKPATGELFLRPLIAAVSAAIVNNLYSLLYTAVIGFSIPKVINPVSVTLFSLVPVILGGFVYWGISRFDVKVATLFSLSARYCSLLL